MLRTRTYLGTVVSVAVLASAVPVAAQTTGLDAAQFFETRVRPLLSKNCFSCHTSTHLGGLTMFSRDTLLKGGNSGPAIVPGKPDQSLLIQAVRQTHERIKMPLGGRLAPEEIADLEAWVKMGAAWPESPKSQETAQAKRYVIRPGQRQFWSFRPVQDPPPPRVKNAAWVKSPIDAFVLAKLDERGLQTVKTADKRTLIRRATYDLIGLPPSPEEVDAFLKDESPGAFAKVVDRLLSSPRYGERWGRAWLDIARYSDDNLNTELDERTPNAFRYRDWVIQAFNADMPYDLFVKAQIAGDLIPGVDNSKYVGGLGFYALRPIFDDEDDRVDATARGFLGLTAACARCHDHKFDPIPTKDYYSLLGVFANTKLKEYPLAPPDVVANYRAHRQRLKDVEDELKEFTHQQSVELAEILAAGSAKYLVAAWRVMGPPREDAKAVAARAKLDDETFRRWLKYLATTKEHPYLKAWEDTLGTDDEEKVRRVSDAFQSFLVSVIKEKKQIDAKNATLLGGARTERELRDIFAYSLEIKKYYLWMDTVFERVGFLWYNGESLERFLHGEWQTHVQDLRERIAKLRKAMPPQYPYVPGIEDVAQPVNLHVYIRGSQENQGEEAPRHFFSILSPGDPAPFTQGSGRLELAEAIASPANPLTARVMVNRIWLGHFGAGIVRTPSNFGLMGDRPSHPELLDWLASRFVQDGWSIKKMHRRIMLSATYQLSGEYSAKNFEADGENRLLWRANRRRMEIEPLRDYMLSYAGKLDLTAGGPPQPLLSPQNLRRTVYSMVSRRKLDDTLRLFDFPEPVVTSEQRLATIVPLQALFFLNSSFVMQNADWLAARLQNAAGDDAARIRFAYRLLFNRAPSATELQAAESFLNAGRNAWPRYSQVLLSSNELMFVN